MALLCHCFEMDWNGEKVLSKWDLFNFILYFSTRLWRFYWCYICRLEILFTQWEIHMFIWTILTSLRNRYKLSKHSLAISWRIQNVFKITGAIKKPNARNINDFLNKILHCKESNPAVHRMLHFCSCPGNRDHFQSLLSNVKWSASMISSSKILKLVATTLIPRLLWIWQYDAVTNRTWTGCSC